MTYTPDTPLEALAGIGPKKAQAFQKLGVATLRDLAGLYPRRYEDRTQFRTIADAQPGRPCASAPRSRPSRARSMSAAGSRSSRCASQTIPAHWT
ncbi:MAG: hypothetical protein ACLSHG_11375 [Oscillospiraceae bacterium]